jgi:hypothetical protein
MQSLPIPAAGGFDLAKTGLSSKVKGPKLDESPAEYHETTNPALDQVIRTNGNVDGRSTAVRSVRFSVEDGAKKHRGLRSFNPCLATRLSSKGAGQVF